VAFLNAELARIGRPKVEAVCTVADTLADGARHASGKKNSLDALCERYSVDHSRRTLHGALLDAQLLADVWLAMTRGQETLDIMLGGAPAGGRRPRTFRRCRCCLRVVRASDAERAEHAAMCQRIERESKGQCLWLRLAAAG
jgi:DNA polymerase-3 subunit epsilon